MSLEYKARRKRLNQMLSELTKRTLAVGSIRIASENGIKEIDEKDFIFESNQKIAERERFTIAERLPKADLAKLTAMISTGNSGAEETKQTELV